MISKTVLQTMPELKTRAQSRPGYCGVAMIRSVLATQFKLRVSETEILNMYKEYCKTKKRKINDPALLVHKYGVTPEFISYCFKKHVNDVKIFCSKKGDVYKLDYLLRGFNIVPILHQMVCYPEFGDFTPDGHYVMFGGYISNFKIRVVKMFDPSRYGGLKYLEHKEFDKKWQNKDEKWFLIAVPNQIRLESKIFKGKYI